MKKITGFIDELSEKYPKIKWLVQFIKFGMVGVSNTLLSLGVTYLAVFIFELLGVDTKEAMWAINVSTAFGFIAGVINSFVLNKNFVFKNGEKQDKKKLFAKVFVCYGLTYLLSVLIMNVLVGRFNVPNRIAPIPRYIITIPLNFIANKLWAFKDK